MTPNVSAESRTHVIRDAQQLRALRTPLRNEVLNAVQQLEPCSVSDVAERLGRIPSSVHYHVMALAEAGLVLKNGSRHTGRREEALFRSVAKDIELDARINDPDYRAAIADTYRATLGVAQRQLERSLEADAERPERARTGMLLQRHVRLSDDDHRRLREKLMEIFDFALEHDDPEAEQGFALTAVLSSVTQ